MLDLLPRLDDVDFAALSELEQRMLQMFYVTVWGKAAESWTSDEVLDNLYALSDTSSREAAADTTSSTSPPEMVWN